MADSEHLSLGSVAKRCNVSRTTAYRWIVSGQLKSYCLPSGHFRVLTEDLDAFRRSFHLPDRPPRRPMPDRLNVLAADDHPDALLLFRRVAERYLPEAAIHEAVNGVDACVACGALRPQVLILDIMMPGMDGFQVLQELLQRPELAGARVVVVSAYEPFARVTELGTLNPQITATLRKPVRVEELGAALQTAARLAGDTSVPVIVSTVEDTDDEDDEAAGDGRASGPVA
jgi:excisionase family DNA binding protein